MWRRRYDKWVCAEGHEKTILYQQIPNNLDICCHGIGHRAGGANPRSSRFP